MVAGMSGKGRRTLNLDHLPSGEVRLHARGEGRRTLGGISYGGDSQVGHEGRHGRSRALQAHFGSRATGRNGQEDPSPRSERKDTVPDQGLSPLPPPSRGGGCE